MTTDEISPEEIDAEAMSVEDLVRMIREEELTLEEIRENDQLRRKVQRIVLKADMVEHNEIYQRLAEV